jgi:DNA-binding CsgD family transcriptional regulator
VANSSALAPALVGRSRELTVLNELLERVSGGTSAVLVVRGEAGMGKTSLLEYLVSRASGLRVVRIVAAESEIELAYAGLHQLCSPMLDGLEALPTPQRRALAVALGLRKGRSPDRFLVALAALNLLASSSATQPLLCTIDDAQWLDQASRRALSFVARRVLAEPMAIVFAVREPSRECDLAGLPNLALGALDDQHSRLLLSSVMPGSLDDRIRERILAEAGGNPLALLQFHAELSPAELAGGYGFGDARPLTRRIESTFTAQLDALPTRTRQLLLVAACDPVGSSALLWRAGELLELGADDAAPAEAVKLITFGTKVQFTHPLVRSAIYRTSTMSERQRAHQALADAIDPTSDRELRAWHRAQAAPAADETIAAELELSAVSAQARGGVAAAAAFLSRATELSAEPAQRGRRALLAARAKLDAGATDASRGLVAIAEAVLSNDLQRAHCELLRGRIAFASHRFDDAASLFLTAAEHLAPLDPLLARETLLEAMCAAVFGDPIGSIRVDPRAVACAATSAPLPSSPPRGVDLLLDGLMARYVNGYARGAPLLKAALCELRQEYAHGPGDPRWHGLVGRVALDVWDQDAWDELAERQVTMLRDSGLLTPLPAALAFRAGVCMHAGRFDEADALLEEANAISGGSSTPPRGYIEPVLAAYRGHNEQIDGYLEACARHQTPDGRGGNPAIVHFAAAILHNSRGEYTEALKATNRAIERDDLGLHGYALIERVEAAAYSGQTELAAEALRQLVERTQHGPTGFALGLAARSRALLTTGPDAEALYREAINDLKVGGVDLLLARAYLIYGEWLRREDRYDDAVAQLNQAHGIFLRVGAASFAERARRELHVLGHSAAKPTSRIADLLTNHESHIARLARDGHTNQEIAAQLFISPRTVEWHLGKIFPKLNIRSRRGLRHALAELIDG